MDAPDVLRMQRVMVPVRGLGHGVRVGLWVQGCTIGCAGCASTDTWSTDGGITIAIEDLADRLAGLLADADGLSLTGGEPLQQAGALTRLLDLLADRGTLDQVDVLLFTGYAPARARTLGAGLWQHLDAAVAGPYRADRPNDHPLVASANQELMVLSDLGRHRYGDVPDTVPTTIDVSTANGDLVMAGLPRPGDLDRFRELMAARGISMGGASWER